MPLPLLAPAAPALLAAAEWTLAACATGLTTVGVMESTKDKEGEQDKVKADTQTITSSRTECEKCPAIGNVTMIWQAERQNRVCIGLNNIPKSHWHFLQPISYEYFSEMFVSFTNIKTFHMPIS
ncbi:Tox-REase-5 domain-containing protein [Photorhabdus akhurstii]|uniref:Tox-REase-5 domain-containing protein n=1 Tax=Photorhabdus akhurstii TaxID=171438 RepID=UPI001BD5D1CC|nr:Tox-REase-5 domain-containing protein [Photorhabdus akhurstii]MBS9428104.1 hypothetical protein [Photorhabdus akhurstii]